MRICVQSGLITDVEDFQPQIQIFLTSERKLYNQKCKLTVLNKRGGVKDGQPGGKMVLPLLPSAVSATTLTATF